MKHTRSPAMLAVGLLAAAAASGCHSGFTPQDAGSDDAAGDSSGPCVCQVPTSAGEVLIACTATGCADGVEYICTGAAALVTLGACGDAAAGDAGGDEAPCSPVCDHHTCGNANGCGGTCECLSGVPCNPDQTCGNGCTLVGKQTCVVGSTTSSSCCSDGYSCQASDAGTALCCVLTGSSGQCGASTDCCDYPKAQCDTFSGTCN
jgi:hypothetical protein